MMRSFQPRASTAFEVPEPSKIELRDLERAFTRLFSTDDGKKVLSYLHAVTFMRAAGMDTPDSVLRYMEGQRALLAMILRMIDRGRQG